jgi:hypothetical protein
LLSFPISIGAGQANATLTFSKSGTMTVSLLNSGGGVKGQASGTSSPLSLSASGLTAGSYTYIVSGADYKGNVSFTLTVTTPTP